LRAYFERFTGGDDVTLVLKTFPNPHNDVGELLARLRAEWPNPPDVRWIDRDLPDDQLTALYNIASCYVHSARGEGFGLPVAEAMLAEVPVIAVAHGGLADFCDDSTVRTVPFTIEPANSHVSVLGSMWAEPDPVVLGDHLRAEFEGADPQRRGERVRRAKQVIESEYTWAAVAERWRRFLEEVELARAVPRVALVTTFNSRCGIAEYSKYLVRHAGHRVRYELYSDRAVEPLDPDVELDVDRRWDQRWRPDLADLHAALDRSAAEVLHVQFNFGFFELSRLQALLEQQLEQREVVLTLHSTREVDIGDEHVTLAAIAPTLSRVGTILVHQAEDADRLASYGVVHNVLVLPHGTRTPASSDREVVRRKLGLADRTVIGTFGFLVPHKGTLDLIGAVDLLRQELPDVLLLSVSAVHPDPSSAAYLEACRAEIAARGLEAHVTLVTDFLPDPEASALLSASDVIVLPYKQTQESVSGALRFVLPVGRPTVVSDLPIFADVRHALDVVADTSPEGLADKLGKLLADDADLDRLVGRAVGFAHATSWDVIAARHRELYVQHRKARPFDRVPVAAEVERVRREHG
jgi:glycosyltransferase involved in cell wall biosynthesis